MSGGSVPYSRRREFDPHLRPAYGITKGTRVPGYPGVIVYSGADKRDYIEACHTKNQQLDPTYRQRLETARQKAKELELKILAHLREKGVLPKEVA